MRGCIIFVIIVASIVLLAAGGYLFYQMYWARPAEFVINGTPVNQATYSAFETQIFTAPAIDRVNPLGTPSPLALPTEIPSPTPTADPVAYRTQALLLTRQFGTTLESVLDLNEQLQTDPSLIDNAEWRSELRATLELFVASAWALGGQPSVPEEYQPIDVLLDQVGPEAEALRDHYLTGLETGDEEELRAAADSMNRIVELMIQVENAMAIAGWGINP